jgi:hypothetical protein
MRIYAVAVAFGQHESYYVHAEDVATAARFALERDDSLWREAGNDDKPDHYRRVKGVTEYCECEQFVGPPVNFTKKNAA